MQSARHASFDAALAIAPAQVVVGPGLLAEALAEAAGGFGRRALVVGGRLGWQAAEAPLRRGLAEAGLRFERHRYDPDCTEAERLAACQAAGASGADLVVGVGGGKALDLAKLVAASVGLPCITVPTSAATCAAMTALGNLYSPAGAHEGGEALPVTPVACLVDTELIALAPPRLLAAGMLDALAKWVEASSTQQVPPGTMAGRTALAIARQLHDELLEWGVAAHQDALAGRRSPRLERAIEACIVTAGLVGGLGGASCRAVVAHGVADALTAMPGQGPSLHGEKVAYGMLVQRQLQGLPEEAHRLWRFATSLGLCPSLAGLGMAMGPVALDDLAERVAQPHSAAQRYPGGVKAEALRQAMDAVEAMAPHPEGILG